jgi:hypothetical protein
MKIYSVQRPDRTLKDFVGKDVWVATISNYDNQFYYIRILSETPQEVKFNQVDAYEVLIHKWTRKPEWVEELFTKPFIQETNDFYEEYSLIKPLNALTSDEVKDILLS